MLHWDSIFLNLLEACEQWKKQMLIATFYFSAVTTTGRKCYWRQTAPGKDPGVVSEKQYGGLRQVTRRNLREPRPSQVANDSQMTLEQLRELQKDLEENLPSSILFFHISAMLEACGEYEGIQDIAEAAERCSEIMWKRNRKCAGKEQPFEVPGTRGQADNKVWFDECQLCCSASDCKQLLGLSSGKSKMRYLRRKVWRKDEFQSENMRLGKEKEGEARQKYVRILRSYGI